ncbi:MAG: DMT family transporter [Clostridiales bacterium]|nr:DMT family transporter [Clostridiales bacterium]
MSKAKAIIYAVLAAVFYAVNLPFSKILLQKTGPATMAALLYLGAGIGIGIVSLFNRKGRKREEKLSGKDLPFVIGMIVLDIAAPIFLMLGISYGSSANASLLSNFEIAATTVIALVIFKEAVSKRLWSAISLITLSSILLSFEGSDSFRFSYGSLFVLLATVCWGFENNCTRKISSKSTYDIVILKGIFSGLGSLIIALIKKETMPDIKYIAAALMLGFVAYGLSIFLYVRAQNTLGTAKTSAYYAAAPFIGALLSFVFLKESLSWLFAAALIVMLAGSALVVADTLIRQHSHIHNHTFSHTHDGTTHTHMVVHEHEHSHYITDDNHNHHHTAEENTLSDGFKLSGKRKSSLRRGYFYNR